MVVSNLSTNLPSNAWLHIESVPQILMSDGQLIDYLVEMCIGFVVLDPTTLWHAAGLVADLSITLLFTSNKFELFIFH